MMGGRDELERLFEPRTGDGVRRRRTHAVTAGARRPPVLSPSAAGAQSTRRTGGHDRRGLPTDHHEGTGEVPGTPTPVKRDRENRS